MELKHTKVLIVGFGRSGQAAARFCAEGGAHVTVCDAGPAERFAAARAAVAAWPMSYRFGEEPVALFCQADLVVASPGVPLATAGLRAARAAGIPVVSEMELALQVCRTPIIAVTGTNGKSTTTTLIGAALQQSGIPVAVGGNLGTPALALVPAMQRAAWAVLEVSSYQLEITPSLHPRIAVLLNITPDHLDRYVDFDAYVAAKGRLLAPLTPADTLIFSAEDPIVTDLVADTLAIKAPFAVDAARRAQALGACWNDGCVTAVVPGHCLQEWDLTQTVLVGKHNRENMLAAGLAAAAAGATAAAITATCRSFPGLPHRCQLVRERNGVRYYDDSKATNVGAVVKSLASFSSPVVLIAGGLDKGTGYATLRDLAPTRVKCAILIGQAREMLRKALTGATETVLAADMASAVRIAADQAAPGEVVLLAPACASFDMYRDYAERGEDFTRCVQAL